MDIINLLEQPTTLFKKEGGGGTMYCLHKNSQALAALLPALERLYQDYSTHPGLHSDFIHYLKRQLNNLNEHGN